MDKALDHASSFYAVFFKFVFCSKSSIFFLFGNNCHQQRSVFESKISAIKKTCLKVQRNKIKQVIPVEK